MNKEEALQASDTALQELATALRQGKSDSLLHYLSMLSRFHRYSFSNCMLISLQKPDATLVAGFQRWKSLGRFVKRNERGIALLAPMISRPKTESADEADSAESTVRVLRGFRVVHVFDVSQTEGRELASFASLAGDPGDWLPRLEGLVASHGIRLEYPEVVLQNANGASFGGLIHVSSRLPMAQKLSTLAHELAHELLHQGADQRPSSKAVLETEAEAVAWVVCRACGLDCFTRAADDIQLWDGDEQTLLQSLERGPQRRHSTCYSEHCAATIMGILQISSRLRTCCHQAPCLHGRTQGVGLEFESHLQRAVSPEDTPIAVSPLLRWMWQELSSVDSLEEFVGFRENRIKQIGEFKLQGLRAQKDILVFRKPTHDLAKIMPTLVTASLDPDQFRQCGIRAGNNSDAAPGKHFCQNRTTQFARYEFTRIYVQL